MAQTSRKIYREVAGALKGRMAEHDPRDMIDVAVLEGIAKAARTIADVFKRDNPMFRYDTFYAACGLNEWGHAVPPREN